jgi:hypothetical protein
MNAQGNECWSARDLARVLEYSEFRHFLPVIEKAKEACLKSQHRVEDHFEHVLDHMGSTELAANLFRGTQTEEKLRRENVRNKDHASRIHNEVGRKVRLTARGSSGATP